MTKEEVLKAFFHLWDDYAETKIKLKTTEIKAMDDLLEMVKNKK